MSAVIVATITRSSSAAWTPASRRAASAAGRQRSEVACSGAAIRRSLIPVRVWIHSSLVSTISASSSFASTRSGRVATEAGDRDGSRLCRR